MNKTKKQGKSIQTIPQLRKAFDYIETITRRGIDLETFKKEWEKVFDHEIDSESAKSWLEFHKKSGKKNTTRKHKQKGGSGPLAGAPLDFTTRPGNYDVPYGSFLEYVGSGLDFYNKINTNSIVPTQCGKENITPQLPADLGSNKVGGGRRRKTYRRKGQKGGGFPSIAELANALTFRPFQSTNPPTVQYDAQMAFKGQGYAGSSPSPTDGTPPYVKPPTTVSANYPVYDITRQLSSELR